MQVNLHLKSNTQISQIFSLNPSVRKNDGCLLSENKILKLLKSYFWVHASETTRKINRISVLFLRLFKSIVVSWSLEFKLSSLSKCQNVKMSKCQNVKFINFIFGNEEERL